MRNEPRLFVKTDPLGDINGGGRRVTQEASVQRLSPLVHAAPTSWRPAASVQ